ncbi:MAG: GIY-YIG nuclease family protein [Planctomycetaceae bacterium]
MPSQSELRLIKHALEYQEQTELKEVVPKGTRGIYVLYKRRGAKKARENHYDVVYIGMTTLGIRGRLQDHVKKMGDLWSHFSMFEVWDNISDDEIVELEGIFRHFYPAFLR